MSKPLYPHIRVRMKERDANAFEIISKVSSSMRGHRVDHSEIDWFMSAAMSGSYADLKSVCRRFVKFQEGAR